MNSSPTNKDQPIKRCQECRRVEFQYQCPRCNFRSCSLPCCRAHKQRTQCTGKRDRTSFIKVGDMSDATLQNDYHFLEDVIGRMDANRRFVRQSGGKQQQQQRPKRQREGGYGVGKEAHALLQAADKDGIAPKRFILPIEVQNNKQSHRAPGEAVLASSAAAARGLAGLSNLQNQARQRGVSLLRLPPFMERYKRNETRLRNKMIYWTIEWRIYGDVGDAKTTTVAQTCETVVLYDELRRLVANADELLPQHSLLLKNVLSPANAPKYSKISASSTLSDALIDQTIIEFPTIHAVSPGRLKDFPLLIEINSNVEASNNN